ncbi:MAG: hypothetical protein ACE37F_22980 [Nannocystaceae bacterium]|nr:hypothetical protein [bacterium]
MRRWLPLLCLLPGCFSDPPDDTLADSEVAGTGTGGDDAGDGSGLPTSAESTAGTDTGGLDDESSATSGSDAESSTGEAPLCGDGVVDMGEHCDGADPPGAACLDDCRISCLEPFEDCDGIPVNGCEVDTITDPNNCGACGRVCAIGICEESACAPVAVAQGIGFGPTRIARDADTLVFDESGFGGIFAWEIGADEPTTLVEDDLTGVFRRFAIAQGHVYWLDGNMGAVQRAPIATGGAEFLFAIEDGGAPVATDDGVFFPSWRTVDLSQVSDLLRIATDTPSESEAVVAERPGLICQVVEAGGRLVFSTTVFDDPVQSVDLDEGGAPTSHAALPQDACNRPLFGVGPSIYFYGRAVPGGPFGLVSHNIGNGTSTLLIQEPTFDAIGDYYVSAHGIVIDVDDEIRLYDLTGGDPIVIGAKTEGSIGRYVDDELVAWTELEDNTWTLLVAERP